MSNIFCDSCGNKSEFMQDTENGELVCKQCGLVVSEDLSFERIPSGKFNKQSGRSEVKQHGAYRSGMIHDYGMSTMVGHFLDLAKLTREQKTRFFRLRKWQSKTRLIKSRDRNLAVALNFLTAMCVELAIPKSVREEASKIYRVAYNAKLVRGRTISHMVGASLYYACRIHKVPRTLKDVASTNALKSESERDSRGRPNTRKCELIIARSYRIMLDKLSLRPPAPSALPVVTQICSSQEIAHHLGHDANAVEQFAAGLLQEYSVKKFSGGKAPQGLAAAAIYIAIRKLGVKKITQRMLADVAQVTEVTVRNRYRGLVDDLGMDVSLKRKTTDVKQIRVRLFTDQQLIDLHAEGLDDRDIADRFNVTQSAVNSRRRNLGIERVKTDPPFTDQQLIDLHSEGFNDREIADRVGVSRSMVNNRRRKLGIKRIKRVGRLFTDQQLIDLHAEGLNDREIGEKLGVGRVLVGQRRRELGIKRIGVSLFTDQQLIDLHSEGFNDREIADRFNVSQSAVNSRRRKLGIKRIEQRIRVRLFTDQQLIDLHAEGLNDIEIGEKLGVGRILVGQRRRELGIERVKTDPPFTDQQLIDLHSEGFNDREIADRLNVARRVVNGRRRKLGIKRIRRSLFTDQQLIDLHVGLSDREMGEKLGTSQSLVSVRRKKLGIEKNIPRINHQRFLKLYEEGFNDREIAEKLGFGTRSIGSHRRKFGFKTRHVRLFTDEELIVLHAEGLNDREVGEKLGASEPVVGYHRRRLGLKAIVLIKREVKRSVLGKREML